MGTMTVHVSTRTRSSEDKMKVYISLLNFELVSIQIITNATRPGHLKSHN